MLAVAVTALTPLCRFLPDDVLGGALLGLVVGSVAFLFTHLAELVAGAV